MLKKARLLTLWALAVTMLFSLSVVVAEPVTLDFLIWSTPQEMTIYKKFINAFEKEYPQIKINVQTMAWSEYWSKLPVLFASGTVPDVLWMHDSRIYQFAELGVLAPLDPLIKKDPPYGWPNDYVPIQIEAFNVGGQQYALPYDFASTLVIYNKSYLDEAGLSYPSHEWTVYDMEAYGKKLTKQTNDKIERYGLGLASATLNGMNIFEPFMRAFGGGTVNKERTKSILAEPGSIDAVQFRVDLYFKHKIEGGNFAQGTAAIAWDASWVFRTLSQLATKDLSWDVVRAPKGPGGRNAIMLGGSATAIPKLSKHPAEAWTFIKFWNSPTVQNMYSEDKLLMPVLKSSMRVGKGLAADIPPGFIRAALENVDELGNYPYYFTRWGEMQTRLAQSWSPLANGRVSVANEMITLSQFVDTLLQK